MDDVVITKASARPLEAGTEVRQFQFGLGMHDSLQYNFFAEDKIFSVRVMEMRTLKHHYAWLYDGGLREIVNSEEPWELSGDAHVDLNASRFQLRSDDDGGSTVVFSEASEPVFGIDFTTPIAAPWGTPAGGAFIHQPLIQADVHYDGKTYKGIGYCKRYWFLDDDPKYMGWRFIEGEVGGRRYMLWGNGARTPGSTTISASPPRTALSSGPRTSIPTIATTRLSG